MDLSFLLENKLLVSVFAGILSILYALFLSYRVLQNPRGNEKMNDIADAISEGASAYMKRQYTVVAIIGVVIFAVLYFTLGFVSALGFAVGAIFSTIAAFVTISTAFAYSGFAFPSIKPLISFPPFLVIPNSSKVSPVSFKALMSELERAFLVCFPFFESLAKLSSGFKPPTA